MTGGGATLGLSILLADESCVLSKVRLVVSYGTRMRRVCDT